MSIYRSEVEGRVHRWVGEVEGRVHQWVGEVEGRVHWWKPDSRTTRTRNLPDSCREVANTVQQQFLAVQLMHKVSVCTLLV